MNDRIPKVDSNTQSLVTWTNGKFEDLAGKLSWEQHNLSSKITISDSTYGHIYVGGSAWYRASCNTPNELTLDAAIYWDGKNLERTCWFGLGSFTGGAGGDGEAFFISSWGDENRDEVAIDRINHGTDYTPLKVGWNHVAATLQGQRGKLFVNGVLTGFTDYPRRFSSHFCIARCIIGDYVQTSPGRNIAWVRLSNCIRYTSNFDAGGANVA